MKVIKTYIKKNRERLLIAFSIIVAIFGITNLYFVLNVTPNSNDECLWINKPLNKDSVQIFFEQVKVDGVTWNAGIRNGDRLIAINGIMLKDGTEAQRVLNRMKAGEYARYTVGREESSFETRVYIKKLINIFDLSFTLLGIIWFAIGFVVLMAKPDGKVQKLFYLIGAAFVFSRTYLYIPLYHLAGPVLHWNLSLFWSLLSLFSGILIPTMMLHFFWIFPKPYKFISRRWILQSLYGVALLIFVFVATVRVLLNFYPKEATWLLKYFGILNYMQSILLTASVVFLVISYFRLKSREERKPLYFIMIAFILGLSSTLYTNTIAPVLADNFFNSPEYFTPIILLVLIPIAFAYSIFKYQLMDVSVVVKNTIIYGLATITIAAIYLLTVYGLGQSIAGAVGPEYRNAVAALAFVLFALLFQSTKDKFQDLLTRKFYPEQFAYQKVILKFSNDVVSIVGLEKILDSMKETFISSLSLTNFGILLKDDKSGNFVMKRCSGIGCEEFVINGKDNLLTNYVRETLLLKMPVYIERSKFDEIFPEDREKLRTAGVYTVIPMVIKAKVIGLLLFGLKRSGSQFAGKDIELLCAAASQAGVSIENARLYQSEAQRFAIERDLDNARRIQEALLPKAIPSIECLDISGKMIPAMQVGGDYYDIIKVAPSKLFIVVGDVSGKGLSASLYMSKLQTMMRLTCTEDKSPRDILVDLNRKIYESIERNWFITVNLALIDTDKSVIRFCRAGHSQLLEISNSHSNLYQPKGIGLGLEEGKVFADTLEELEIPYSSGSIFAFFSDGISEAMNEQDELFGVDELKNAIAANKNKETSLIMESIMDTLDRFRGQREQNDDITLVLLKIK